jgi:photosystem II stability/assembly factor-like uncharacterized protein
MNRIWILLLLIFSAPSLYAQPSVEVLATGTKTSIRGLSVVNDNIVWVSGSNGMVGRSNDAGKTWKWFNAKKFIPDDSMKLKADFRDIEAFDDATAIILSVDAPAYILKTNDGGETWKPVYENKAPGMFLDAMEFWNERSGIVIGDPIGKSGQAEKRFFIARTFDGGNSWQEIPFDKRPVAGSGEACFAASGTNIRTVSRSEAVFVSGGLRSRLFSKDRPAELPVIQGSEMTGANSIAIADNTRRKPGRKMIIVAGDYLRSNSTDKNCVFTTDGGKTWQPPRTPPNGYRSCVEYISATRAVTCGLTGVDFTGDGGLNWTSISKEGFHVCRKAKSGTAVFFAGGNGKIGKLVFK